MKKISIGMLIIAILIPLLIGGTSAVLSNKGMVAYATMNKPPLSPPAWVFSVAWTILYIMMGVASYYIIASESDNRSKAMALIVYAIQLVMNFFWSIIFFNIGAYFIAFLWLLMMWCIVILCTLRFYSINRTAAWLMVPYVLWLTFAAYLNLGTHILNK